jgi:glycosyltransferase involved in cell wall biosynthesis
MAQHYAPESVSGAVLATELATDLKSRGHEVTFVTCTPNYPEGKPFPGYRNSIYQREWIDGVEVIRTWSYITTNKGTWSRLFNYGTFSVGAFFGGLSARKPDVILSASPPLPLGISAWLLSALWRVPWVLRVEDLFPETAVVAGVIRGKLSQKLLYALETFLYRRAEHISLISESFRKYVLDKGIAADKLSVFPVWADPDQVQPLPRENAFRQRFGLGDKFVVMYSGNLGFTSCIEDVIQAADLLQGDEQVIFVLIGEGVKKESLKRTATEMGLANICFLPYQPRDAFAEMLAASDLGVVTLNREHARTSLPSKIFNIMASERPVLAIAPEESDISRLVREAECGIAIEPGNAPEIAQAITRLKDDVGELKRLGKNGRAKLVSDYSRQRCVGLYEQIMQYTVHRFRDALE